MFFIKKKLVQVFADGSLIFNRTVIKQAKKIKIENKDHTTLNLNKKNISLLVTSKNFKSLKTKYFKF